MNGDGRADIVGFGFGGTYTALGQADGTFAAPILASNVFGTSAAAGGWFSQDQTTRLLGDVNGDGRADIVGFGFGGTFTALGQADGTFAAPILASNVFGSSAAAGGWFSQDQATRLLGDVNGDGRADIVGFGFAGTYTALGQADGTFAAATLTSNAFGTSAAAGGWVSQDQNPRVLGDVNGDARADIVGFGFAGTYTAFGQAMVRSRRPSSTLPISGTAPRPAAGPVRTPIRGSPRTLPATISPTLSASASPASSYRKPNWSEPADPPLPVPGAAAFRKTVRSGAIAAARLGPASSRQRARRGDQRRHLFE